MSKLEELIKEFCPNGVEHVKLCDVADFRAGSSFPEREQGRKAERYPFYKVVDMNKTQIYMEKANNYINEETCTKLKCKPAPKGTIIFPKVGATMGTNKKRILSIEACYDNNIMGLFAKNIDPKFLYYCFSKVDLLSLANGKGAVPSLDTEKMARIQIPLPALPVQREIVRILDSFTLYSAELTAELTARRKQYEFYRDKLLTFDDTISANVKKIELGNIADIAVGTKPEQVFEEKNLYEYINAGTTNSGYVDSYNCLGDTVTTPSRGQGGIGFVGYQRQNFWLGPLCYKIKSNTDEVLTKYIFHYLQNNTNLILSLKKEGGVPAVNRSDLVKIPLIYPPRAVQERIVKVLDNFDEICSNLKIGLPAEMEKRQQQYEYYRDKLLEFNVNINKDINITGGSR